MVIGTVAIDSVETPFGNKEEVFGGSASYFSYASSFFTPVDLVAVVGSDFPPEYKQILKERPIGLDHLEVIPNGQTFRWKGKYGTDLNVAQTLETHLNVLLEFKPSLKNSYEPQFLFLANIDPGLQLEVLRQVKRPKCKLVACDTMNFWISQKKQDLLNVLKHVDLIVINDGEARQLANESNLIKAAKMIQGFGPSIVVIKKGEHGVLLFSENKFFALPAYPLEEVFDPTGAGDTFAGGLMGYLAKEGKFDFETLRRAVAHGSIVASFTVEQFGLERLRSLSINQIDERLQTFKHICHF